MREAPELCHKICKEYKKKIRQMVFTQNPVVILHLFLDSWGAEPEGPARGRGGECHQAQGLYFD